MHIGRSFPCLANRTLQSSSTDTTQHSSRTADLAQRQLASIHNHQQSSQLNKSVLKLKNKPDKIDKSTWFETIKAGDIEKLNSMVCSELLRMVDEDGKNALYHAMQIDNLQETPNEALVLFLLQNEAETFCVPALHKACASCSVKFIEELLRYYNINHTDHEGRTPLHLACEYNHLEAIQLLLNKGAISSKCDDCGLSPMYTAIQSKNFDACALLVQEGKTFVSPLNPAEKAVLKEALETCNQSELKKLNQLFAKEGEELQKENQSLRERIVRLEHNVEKAFFKNTLETSKESELKEFSKFLSEKSEKLEEENLNLRETIARLKQEIHF